jgi:hypothetical protein
LRRSGAALAQPLGQPQIVATVMNGWFSAWWPGQLADPNAPAGGALQPHIRNMPAVTIQGLDANGEVINQIRG